jgi:hypothetical protein
MVQPCLQKLCLSDLHFALSRHKIAKGLNELHRAEQLPPLGATRRRRRRCRGVIPVQLLIFVLQLAS